MRGFVSEPSIHEEKIIQFFSGDVYNTGTYDVLDQTFVVVLFTNRCGSNLFASYIQKVFGVGDLGETLNYQEVATRGSLNDIKSFQDYIYKNALPYAIERVPYGVKASLQQLAMLARWNILTMFSRVIIFQVERRDLLAQAVSMLIASQTGQWSSNMAAERSDVEFDFDLVSAIIRDNAHSNSSGRLVMEALGFPYEIFEYELFSKNPLSALTRVAKALGIPLDDFVVPEPGLKRQADEKNEALKNVYRCELRKLLE